MEEGSGLATWILYPAFSRILLFPVELPWIEGSCLVTERGMTAATGNWYCGLHEFADMALLLHYFGNKEATGGFLDVGANVGSYTILAAAVCGQKCVAFEPLLDTHRRLLRNLHANAIEGCVEALCAAIGAHRGTVRFTSDRDTTNQVVRKNYTGPTTEVPVLSLDEVLLAKGEVPGFWKVDVEGFEKEVLAGARRCLTDPKVRIVLLEGDDPEISMALIDNGFQQVIYDPFSRSLSVAVDSLCSNNHVWVRDPDEVESRCGASRKYRVLGVDL